MPAAQAFYAGVFGWTFTASGENALATTGGRTVAGLFHRARPKDSAGHPRWVGFFSVNDVTKAQTAVTNAGGTVVLAPRSVPAHGELAVFADHEGAMFGVLKSGSGDPEDYLPNPGEWIWMQLLSRDAVKAGEFYHNISGCEVIANPATGQAGSYLLTSGGYARAAVRTIPADNTDVRPTWLPYVRVASVAATVAQATSLGGAVLVAPKPEVLDGHMAVIADPTGAAIGILEWNGKKTN